MMPREHLVGTIHGSGADAMLLIEFSGEGAVSVVYATGHVADLSPTGYVVKFVKPQPFLDMETLHYSLSIHDGYPNHALRMTPEQRLHQLTTEMIDRMKRERTVFSTDLYRDILETTLTALARDLPSEQPLDDRCLDNARGIHGVVDEALLHHIQQRLEDEEIVDEFVPFFEQLVELIPRTIARWRAADRYRPDWDHAFVKLFGLRLQDFIDTCELQHIATTPEFAAFAAGSRLAELFDVGAKVHFRAHGLSRDKKYAAETGMKNATVLWQFLEFLAGQTQWHSDHYLGLARLWRGRALAVTSGDSADTKVLIESALDVLTDTESLGDRHDALVDLLEYKEQLAPERVTEIIAEIRSIRRQLAPGT
jgi:hypothetical protein